MHRTSLIVALNAFGQTLIRLLPPFEDEWLIQSSSACIPLYDAIKLARMKVPKEV